MSFGAENEECVYFAKTAEDLKIKEKVINTLSMLDQSPHVISQAEWQEISQIPAVRDAWGLEDEVDPLEFASIVYGAKFHFISAGPGYAGDLYILQGDALTELPPMVLRRDKQGHLIVCESAP